VHLEFLTPLGWLVALGAVLALAAFVIADRRERRVRRALGLEPLTAWDRLPLVASLLLLPLLLGAATAQPVIESSRERQVRKDAEVYVVFDTSRSMLASAAPAAPTRFERAQTEAVEVRAALPDIPVGVASLTNRLLPHLFPTADESAFATTVEQSIGIERPPPEQSAGVNVTTFAPLADLQPDNYFDAKTTHRLAIVFTDGETVRRQSVRLRRSLIKPPGVHVIFVHVADPTERVLDRRGRPEAGYRADPRSGEQLDSMAKLLRGRSFDEDELGQVAPAARDMLGPGLRVAAGTERRSYPLAPYVALAGFVPLALILRRRNV
jgi:hypothetical protein